MNLLMGFAFGAGSLLAVQATVNARLGKELANPALATLISFLVGTLGILLYLAITRPAMLTMAEATRTPGWAWLGGLLGALYVGATIVLTPRIGVAAMSGLSVAGQMCMSIVLDHFGLLGLTRHPVSALRILGAVLLVVGAALINSSSRNSP
jgi:transporter family-2 protein